MLDEPREYQLYTHDPLDSRFFAEGHYRLRYRTFIENNFSGLRRALEIIARKNLFDDGIGTWPDNERMIETARLLDKWCSEWVENYIVGLCDYRSASSKGKKADAQKEEALEKWRKKLRQSAKGEGFSAPLFDVDRQWEDDRNRVTYQRAIADALRQGPLKRRYLAGDRTVVDNLKSGKRKLDKRSRSKIVGLTAMILLQEGYHSTEGFVEISPDRLQDWLALDRGFEKSALDNWEYAGKPIFTTAALGKSQSLWHVDAQWLADGGWQLVDADDDAAIAKARRAIGDTCVFYCDEASGFVATRIQGETEMVEVEKRALRDIE